VFPRKFKHPLGDRTFPRTRFAQYRCAKLEQRNRLVVAFPKLTT